jgi:hypothetical protein
MGKRKQPVEQLKESVIRLMVCKKFVITCALVLLQDPEYQAKRARNNEAVKKSREKAREKAKETTDKVTIFK